MIMGRNMCRRSLTMCSQLLTAGTKENEDPLAALQNGNAPDQVVKAAL